MSQQRVNVTLVRGHHPTPWGLHAWEALPSRFDVRVLVTGSQRYPLESVDLPLLPARALRDRLPKGPIGDVAALAVGDRILDARERLADAQIVHTEEISLWFGAQAARLKRELGYRLVVTVWETIPMLDAFRYRALRRYREQVLEAADLYLPATGRARDALLLEGIPEDRIVVAAPGVDVRRFAAGSGDGSLDHHVVISPGRLEWEKGHQDVIRAVAAIKRGMVPAPAEVAGGLRLLLVGSGPERSRLEHHARELGIADSVEFRSVPYDEMPSLYARASCLVLASLPRSGCALTPYSVPHCFWEEQFGLVLAEAMAAGLPLVLSDSGAIPEVVEGNAQFFQPGDWLGIARRLAEGPLARRPGERAPHPPELVERYSVEAAAGRLADAYERVLATAAA